LFSLRGDEVLLIRKKRGIGAGLWNAPGGHVEEGEIIQESAMREFNEEVNSNPGFMKNAGVLDFFMPEDDFSMRVYVFTAAGCSPEPTESEEAIPKWFPRKEIPWGEMWMDDRVWLTHVLDEQFVRATFVIRGNDIVKCEVAWEPVDEPRTLWPDKE
jgi:8-oxo-dGTP diphosphatase